MDGAAAGAGAGAGADAGSDAADDAADDAGAATPAASSVPVQCGGAAAATSSAAAADAGADDANADDAADDAEADDGAAAGDAAGDAAAADGTGAVDDPVTGTFLGFEASSLGLDFGTCTPTVKFEESLNGRKAGEFTFQAIDPVVNQGQQEALNPGIIFNRICDQLGNVCGAAADAIAACEAAQADLSAGTRDETTANAWNEALGFAGTDINPDGAPKAGLVGHT